MNEFSPPPRPAALRVGLVKAFHPTAYTKAAVASLDRLTFERRLDRLTEWLNTQGSSEYNITFTPDASSASASVRSRVARVPLEDAGLSVSAYEAALVNVRESFVRGLDALGFDGARQLHHELEGWLRSQVRPGDWIDGPGAISDFGVQRWPVYEDEMERIRQRLREDTVSMRNWYHPSVNGELALRFYVVSGGRAGSRVSRGRAGHSYARRVSVSEFKGVSTERLPMLVETHVAEALDAVATRLGLGPPPRRELEL